MILALITYREYNNPIVRRFFPSLSTIWVLLAVASGQSQPNRSSVENRANIDVHKPEASGKTEDRLNKADSKFIRDALENSRRLNDLARMAISQASDASVKSLAETLMKDHATANNTLVGIATKGGVSEFMSVAKDYFSERAEVDMRTGEKRNRSDIASLNGSAFDRAFSKEVTERTKASISKFEAGEKDIVNPDLRNFVSSTLPTLEERLQQAQALAK